jgi:hypothetical protein
VGEVKEWFLDPKSIALMAGAAVQLIITVWHSRQTADLVAELVAWRLEVVETMSALETRVGVSEGEITRLRDAPGRT